MDDPQSRPVLGFLTSLGVVLLLSFAGLVGYYSAACTDSGNAVGTALVLVMFVPLVVPQTAIGVLLAGSVAGLAGSVFLRPADSIQRFGATCMTSVVAALVILVVSEKIANAAGAYARCSMGF